MDTAHLVLSMHKGIGYLILLLVAVFVIALLLAMFSNSGNITKFLRKSTLFTMIFFHLQAVVGLVYLFCFSGFMTIVSVQGMGRVMQNADLRFKYIEHPFSMIVIAVLMTIINKYVKSNEKLAMKIPVFALFVVILFGYAFPWKQVFGA